jgi:hypothetical protein
VKDRIQPMALENPNLAVVSRPSTKAVQSNAEQKPVKSRGFNPLNEWGCCGAGAVI